MRKRDRLEVIYDMLSEIRDSHNSILPTPLMRKSNLSSQGFTGYCAELLDKGFIKEIPDRKGRGYLTLTDKGFTYLERYRTIRGFIDEFEL